MEESNPPLNELKRRIARDSRQAVAKQLGVTDALLGMIVNGDRNISKEVGRKLGYERRCVWKKIRPKRSK